MTYIFCMAWIAGLMSTIQSTAIGIEEEGANCTDIGVARTCCLTTSCVFVECDDGDRCEYYSAEEAWPEDCQHAENKCPSIMEEAIITTLAPPGEYPRQFDSASFIGGMVLAAAVLCIVFASCKIYKNKMEGKYTQM